MKINKKKSMVMRIKDRMVKRNNDEDIGGYPVTDEYKYLGLTLKSTLSIKAHIDNLEAKVYKIMFALKNIRGIANAKFNNNLFKILVVPSYTLMKGVFFWLSNR